MTRIVFACREVRSNGTVDSAGHEKGGALPLPLFPYALDGGGYFTPCIQCLSGQLSSSSTTPRTIAHSEMVVNTLV